MEDKVLIKFRNQNSILPYISKKKFNVQNLIDK